MFLDFWKSTNEKSSSIFCWCNLISIDNNVYFYQNRQMVTKKEKKVNKFTVMLISLQMKTHTMNLTQSTKRKANEWQRYDIQLHLNILSVTIRLTLLQNCIWVNTMYMYIKHPWCNFSFFIWLKQWLNK